MEVQSANYLTTLTDSNAAQNERETAPDYYTDTDGNYLVEARSEMEGEEQEILNLSKLREKFMINNREYIHIVKNPDTGKDLQRLAALSLRPASSDKDCAPGALSIAGEHLNPPGT